jgi:hypothetical protein
MANRNWANGGKLWLMETAPVLLTCNFIVDPANGNGLGQRSLKGAAIEQVFMHTTATPLQGNPNPEAGVIVVQLQDNYNRYLGGFSGQVSPIGSPVTSTTATDPAVVTSLGTSTTANWLAVGFPRQYLNTATQLPNIGATFIPTSSAAIGGGATVAPPTASGIDNIEVIGDPNQTIASSQPQNVGAQLILQCMQDGVLTTPATGSVIGLSFLMSNSSVTSGQGE